MSIDAATSIREIALTVPGAAALFDRIGLDYCGASDASLARACQAASLLLADVLAALEEGAHAPPNVAAFHDWRSERRAVVAAHIVEHEYPIERETMADTTALVAKVASVHGERHPELREVEALWGQLCARLRRHQRDESTLIEPLRREDANAAPVAGPSLTEQHEEVLRILRRIRALTRDYAAPSDACDALRTLYLGLAAFESELHEHVLLAESVLLGER